MDLDILARSLASSGSRRILLGALAVAPVAAGLLDFLIPEDTRAKDRRRRRKQRHKRHKDPGRDKRTNRDKQDNTAQPQDTCQPESAAETCAGKCGSVLNTCQQTVDCGSCDCNPACDECSSCHGAPGTPGVCVPKESGTRCSGGGTCDQGKATPRNTCDGSGRWTVSVRSVHEWLLL